MIQIGSSLVFICLTWFYCVEMNLLGMQWDVIRPIYGWRHCHGHLECLLLSANVYYS